MKIYKSCPLSGAARTAWGYFTKKHKEAPKAIWKMPNNFKSEYSVDKGAWGMWVALYTTEDGVEWRDHFDPTKKEEAPVRNIFSFIKKQTILEKTIHLLKGE